MKNEKLSQAARAMRSVNSPAQQQAARENGKKGGRKSTSRMLMNPATGTVQSEKDWYDDFLSTDPMLWGGYRFRDANLIEVVQDESGGWKEAE
jgi:hypothetical protein